jgi:hypothetical protein
MKKNSYRDRKEERKGTGGMDRDWDRRGEKNNG